MAKIKSQVAASTKLPSKSCSTSVLGWACGPDMGGGPGIHPSEQGHGSKRGNPVHQHRLPGKARRERRPDQCGDLQSSDLAQNLQRRCLAAMSFDNRLADGQGFAIVTQMIRGSGTHQEGGNRGGRNVGPDRGIGEGVQIHPLLDSDHAVGHGPRAVLLAKGILRARIGRWDLNGQIIDAQICISGRERWSARRLP